MNKFTRLFLLFLAISVKGIVWGQSQNLLVTANNDSGEVLSQTPVTTESVLRFSAEGVEVCEGEQTVAVIPYTGLNSLTFVYDKATGIGSVKSVPLFGLRENPVYDNLEIIGYGNEPSHLAVYDSAGRQRIAINGWKGESVSVSTLPTGIYYLTINKTTIKFIKK